MDAFLNKAISSSWRKYHMSVKSLSWDLKITTGQQRRINLYKTHWTRSTLERSCCKPVRCWNVHKNCFTVIISCDKCAHRDIRLSQLRQSSPSKALWVVLFVWLTIWFPFISSWFTLTDFVMQSWDNTFYEEKCLWWTQRTSSLLHFPRTHYLLTV